MVNIMNNNVSNHDGSFIYDNTGLSLNGNADEGKVNVPARLLISAAVFGILFSYLFTNQNIGLNFLIFVLLIYGFAIFNKPLFIKKTFRQEPVIYLYSIPVIFLSVLVFLRSTGLNVLSVLVILMTLFVQFLVLSDNALHRWYSPWFFIDVFFGSLNRMLFSLGYFVTGTINKLFKSQSEKKKGAIIGVFVGIMLLILIVPLLMLADPQVSDMLEQLFEDIDLGDAFLYILMFFIGASLITAPAATANHAEFTGRREAKISAGKRPLESITIGVALAMISVVYILFAGVQFTYFFKPAETIASELGLTNSAYAVRGFGELLAVTCLNFIIIAAAMRFTKKKDGKNTDASKSFVHRADHFQLCHFGVFASSYAILRSGVRVYRRTVSIAFVHGVSADTQRHHAGADLQRESQSVAAVYRRGTVVLLCGRGDQSGTVRGEKEHTPLRGNGEDRHGISVYAYRRCDIRGVRFCRGAS